MATVKAPTVAMVALTIDGRHVRAPVGSTVLEAARAADVRIPTLCYHPDLSVRANCRVCVVEVRGSRVLQTACSCPATDGMVVATSTPAIRAARKTNLELLLSSHAAACATCARNYRCELQRLCFEYSVDGARFGRATVEREVDASARWIVRDPNRCVLCRRCVAVCEELQTIGAIRPVGRGAGLAIAPAFGQRLGASACVLCGQCIDHCPVGAIYERDQRAEVWQALASPDAVAVALVEPAVWPALAGELDQGPVAALGGASAGGRTWLDARREEPDGGGPRGKQSTALRRTEAPRAPGAERPLQPGQIVAALRRLGFHRVFDASPAVELAAQEGARELIERLADGVALPVLTAWCPAWVRFVERFYPRLVASLSSCKSPAQMLGALTKTYFAAKEGIDPRRLVVVSATPCVARKLECSRPEMAASGFRDVDYSLSAGELARMLREAGVVAGRLEPEVCDTLTGASAVAEWEASAGQGMVEALVRAAREATADGQPGRLDWQPVEGTPGLVEAAASVDGAAVRAAVVRGLAGARLICDRIIAGEAGYQVVEVMACSTGCARGVAGGWGREPSRPGPSDAGERWAPSGEAERAGPRRADLDSTLAQLYSEFLGAPLGERSRQLLHTRYTWRAT